MTTPAHYRALLLQNAAFEAEQAALGDEDFATPLGAVEIERTVDAYAYRLARHALAKADDIEVDPVEVLDAWSDDYEEQIDDEILTPLFATVTAWLILGSLTPPQPLYRRGAVSIPTTTPIPPTQTLLGRTRSLPAVTQAPAVQTVARDHVDTVAVAHKRTLIRNFNRALGTRRTTVRSLLQDPEIRHALNARIRDNVRLISSIEPGLRNDLIGHLRQRLSADQPFDRASLQKLLQERFGVAESRARLIARDQTSKIVNQLSELRQRQLGITHYRWRTAGDKRVRPTHQANAGQQFSWTESPATGHPGAEIQCRCVPVAIIPDSLRSQLTADTIPQFRLEAT